jgi:hypothetical protein
LSMNRGHQVRERSASPEAAHTQPWIPAFAGMTHGLAKNKPGEGSPGYLTIARGGVWKASRKRRSSERAFEVSISKPHFVARASCP